MAEQWHYIRGDRSQGGPVSVEELRTLLANGELTADDLIWEASMSGWQPARELPRIAAPAAPTAPERPGPDPQSTATVELPAGLLGWMTFVAIVTMIGGAIGILSCLGAVTGALTLVAGVALYGARTTLGGVRQIDVSLAPFFDKLKLYMVMHGLVYILGLLIGLLAVVFYFSIIMAAIAGTAGEW